jgi:DNA polymerase-3 subunit gamma/tau
MKMPLQIQYRPKTLEGIIGNNSLKSVLNSIFNRKEDKKPHAYLLIGESGCGKTTISRIISSHFGAFDSEADSNPDYQEINLADFSGIDTARAIRKTLSYAPIKGKYRVFMLDECHRLTGDAQDALLKNIEEPKNHVIFIFATTNPEKLKTTFKRRCTILKVDVLTDKLLYGYLERVLRKEGKKVRGEVIEAIIKNSKGSLGIALSLLDKIIDLNNSKLQLKEINSLDNLETQVIDLCRELLKSKNWKDITPILNKLKEQNADAENIRRAVLGYCSSILLKEDNGKAALIMDCFINNFYDSGFPGLIHACYSVFMGE